MKYFFICLLALLAFTSCKKDSDDQQKQKSFFRMKVDGVLKEYDSCWILSFQQAAGAQIYYQNNILCGRPGNYAGAAVNNIAPIKAATYLSTVKNTATGLPMAYLGAYRAPGSDDIYISYPAGWPLYDISITFTEYNSEYATGKFSGKLRLIGGSKVMEVTEGEFRALN